MGEIVISDRQLERALYILIIVILGGLAVFLYLRTPSCTVTNSNATALTPPVTAPPQNVTPPAANNTPGAAASCTDGVKNQAETDVDCGGPCKFCNDGKACSVNDDCKSTLCVNQTCKAKVTLSGKAEIFIDRIFYTQNGSANPRLTRVDLTVKNGLETAQTWEVRLFGKTANGRYYLNQVEADERDDEKAIATFQLSGIASGSNLSDSYTVGKYLNPLDSSINFVYDDPFAIEAVLFDSNGYEVANVTKKA
jgi:hypothetical protein